MNRLLAILALPVALAVGSLLLVVLRSRALTRALPPGIDADLPLAPGEILRLRRWERRVRWVLLAVVSLWFVLAGTWAVNGTLPLGEPRSALALLGTLCFVGAAIQFSQRCPRCGYNLGFQSRLLLPDSCERCGGRYR